MFVFSSSSPCKAIWVWICEVAVRQYFHKRLLRILSTGEVSASVHAGIHHPPWQTHPGQTPPGQTLPGQTPTGQTPPSGLLQHPTGMHSCLANVLPKLHENERIWTERGRASLAPLPWIRHWVCRIGSDIKETNKPGCLLIFVRPLIPVFLTSTGVLLSK